MKKFQVICYVLGKYFIEEVDVTVYYAPAVIEGIYSKKEIGELIQNKKDKNILNGIFEIIKNRIKELKVFEVWYDVINYEGTELIWKSLFDAEKKKLDIEVLYSRDNHRPEKIIH